MVSGEPETIVKHYKCSYCGHLEEKVSEISKLQVSGK